MGRRKVFDAGRMVMVPKENVTVGILEYDFSGITYVYWCNECTHTAGPFLSSRDMFGSMGVHMTGAHADHINRSNWRKYVGE